MRTILRITPLALAALLLTACAVPTSGSTPTDQAGPTSSTAAPAASGPSEGTLTVPREIKPGTYGATVPTDSVGCYWSRLKGTSGELADVIANGLAQPGARVTVTIKGTDKAFTSQGCGTWSKRR